MRSVTDVRLGETRVFDGEISFDQSIPRGVSLIVHGNATVNGDVGEGSSITVIGGKLHVKGSTEKNVKLLTEHTVSTTRRALSKLLSLCCLCCCSDCCCRGNKGDIEVDGKMGANSSINSAGYTTVRGTIGAESQIESFKAVRASVLDHDVKIHVTRGSCRVQTVHHSKINVDWGDVFYYGKATDQDTSDILTENGSVYFGSECVLQRHKELDKPKPQPVTASVPNQPFAWGVTGLRARHARAINGTPAQPDAAAKNSLVTAKPKIL